MSERSPVVIPDRSSFKASEVCELLGIQPYVLRTWENEFKDLGVAKAAGAPRVYRRRDVELALRIKALVFTDGLTLAGARRRLEQDRLLEPAAPAEDDALEPGAARSEVEPAVRERLAAIQRGLREILAVLSRSPGGRSGSARAQAPAPEPEAVPVAAGAGASAPPAGPSVSAAAAAPDPAGRGEVDSGEFELMSSGAPYAGQSGGRAAATGGVPEGNARRGRREAVGRSSRRNA